MHARIRIDVLLLALAAAGAAAGAAYAAAPHEHGSARLNVALEGARLEISLEAPLHDLVGFEHAPRDARQRDALAAMERALRDGARHFRTAAEAGCQPEAVELAHPFAADATSKGGQARGGHAELRASWRFACSKSEALRTLEVALFDAFPRLHRVRAQTVTPRGQGGATLTPKRRSLAR